MGNTKKHEKYRPYYMASLVPRLSPRMNRTASDGKLGGAWQRGYYMVMDIIANIISVLIWDQ